MQISELSHEVVTPIIEAVVAETGADFVFDSECEYFNAFGHPQCLVGHVFHRLGVTLPETVRSTTGRDIAANTAQCHRVFADLGGEPSLGAALEAAQSAQDRGKNWGQALEEYFDSLKADGVN